MSIELSRMDFHVTRFMESEDVEEMDSSEVGQYCLLLFKAWMLAKDVTLPVEEDKLARYARVKKVASSVLSKFPVVETEWGKRRQNQVQYGVWMEARKRSATARTKANARWSKERDAAADTAAMPEHPYSNAIPYHTIPEHTKAEQSIAEQEGISVALASLSDKWSER